MFDSKHLKMDLYQASSSQQIQEYYALLEVTERCHIQTNIESYQNKIRKPQDQQNSHDKKTDVTPTQVAVTTQD